MSHIDPSIADFYDRTSEETRLKEVPCQPEEARTRELIQRFAPGPPGSVLDVGRAAGASALWLAEVGYSVYLIDAPHDSWRRPGGGAMQPGGTWPRAGSVTLVRSMFPTASPTSAHLPAVGQREV